MKVVKNNDDNHQPLTLAELEAIQQFEQSERDGGAVFRPKVGAGQPAPNCVADLKKLGRFAITIMDGRYTVEDRRWFRQEADGAMVPVDDNPLEGVWQASKSVRIALEPEVGFQPYVFAVAWFPDMEEDEGILDEADGRSVHLLFGPVELALALADIPRDEEVQTKLSMRYIERDMAVLSRPAAVESEPAEKPGPVSGRAGAMNIGRVETMNVYITVENGGEDAPPLITVQGQ